MSVSEAGADPRLALEALRVRVAQVLDDCEPRELAALAKTYLELLKAVAALPGEEKSNLDDLAARRAARRAEVQKRPASSK